MSLTTRRMLSEIKETTGKSEAELKQQTGLEIKLKTDEESFPEDEQVLKDFHVHKVYGLDSVVAAITAIAKDNLGKEAIKESIKTIVLANTAKSWSDKGSRSVQLKEEY